MEEKEIKNESAFPQENPVMILNSISRMFDFKARKIAETSYIQHSCRVILMRLARRDGLSQVELTEMTHLKAPTVSLDLKKLESMGMVRREQSISDMRVSKVYLTEKGREQDAAFRGKLHETDAMLMQGFTVEEEETLIRLLLAVRENIRPENQKKEKTENV